MCVLSREASKEVWLVACWPFKKFFDVPMAVLEQETSTLCHWLCTLCKSPKPELRWLKFRYVEHHHQWAADRRPHLKCGAWQSDLHPPRHRWFHVTSVPVPLTCCWSVDHTECTCICPMHPVSMIIYCQTTNWNTTLKGLCLLGSVV